MNFYGRIIDLSNDKGKPSLLIKERGNNKLHILRIIDLMGIEGQIAAPPYLIIGYAYLTVDSLNITQNIIVKVEIRCLRPSSETDIFSTDNLLGAEVLIYPYSKAHIIEVS